MILDHVIMAMVHDIFLPLFYQKNKSEAHLKQQHRYMKALSISSKHWRNFDLELQIKFLITQFDKANLKVTALPSPQLLVTLRSLNCATLEVLEIHSNATLYRIKPTGKIYLVNPDGSTSGFSSYEHYQATTTVIQDKNSIILESKEPVYTISFATYDPVITRHKSPKFSATIRKVPRQLDDGQQWLIDLEDIVWTEGRPDLNQAAYAALVKKTVLFILSNTNLITEHE